ncbi:triphosphoribosyl-dephospho-CoA synthase [Halobacillus shinanisalinarum]|uniref:triphosphoribosyl-dephospho-CoA synthase n=1 Tax=Halobacillus shinanisalinarum TaxID=2932258 RepID=A0ABY4GW77_9BACI|nr:triphosphoribosyl-dephospho-CoA synthase [Halobacillus shinanisalinarum]UOQ92314.1 triphosphoribosyl-dephospho-CoA synthase [Halobacillus shinanisalinarum]
MTWNNAKECGEVLGNWAVQALIAEAELSPKPGLVDPEDTGSHADMTFDLLVASAASLRETFESIAEASYLREPDQQLREEIAAIGRQGERKMMHVTGGINTHKGAIWVLGLLTSGAALHQPGQDVKRMIQTASEIACYPDRYIPDIPTHGSSVFARFGVKGARGEAESGFPHLIKIALPKLVQARERGISEPLARLEALVALIAHLDDTCILHRGGLPALQMAKQKAKAILENGGVSMAEGWRKLEELNQSLLESNASPGGSADLLAATLFLDQIESVHYVDKKVFLTT